MLRARVVHLFRSSAVLAIVAMSNIARADDSARARTLYDEAGERERAGDFRGAVERLRAALRIRETSHLHYALGWALEGAGDPDGARAEYRVALARAERDDAREVASLARGRLDALGPAAIVAAPARREAGAARAIERESATGGSRAPWVLVGVGGAFVATGVVLLVWSTRDAAARDEAASRWCAATACTDGTTPTRPETAAAAADRREALDASSRGNTKQALGAAIGGVGVVGAAIGAYLLLRDERGDRPGRVRVDASVTPGLASASATLRF